MAKKRTNLWDYLRTVAEERTIRVQARNQTAQVKVSEGVDAGSIVKDAVAQYGDDVLAAAMAGASAYTGVPMGTPSTSSTATSSTTAAPQRAPTVRGYSGRAPMGSSATSGLPSWALPAALGLGLVVLARR